MNMNEIRKNLKTQGQDDVGSMILGFVMIQFLIGILGFHTFVLEQLSKIAFLTGVGVFSLAVYASYGAWIRSRFHMRLYVLLAGAISIIELALVVLEFLEFVAAFVVPGYIYWGTTNLLVARLCDVLLIARSEE